MPKLVLTFENSVLKEAEVGQRGVKIGRGPDNGLVIDNRAVSHYHGRVYVGIDGRLMLEDFGSLNGTFVNGRRVSNATLKPGDCIVIGKHKILVEDSHDLDGFMVWVGRQAPAAPKMEETAMLGTKERSDFLQRQAAENKSSTGDSAKLPTLVVRKGKTDQREYTLTDNLTVIGKSSLATIKLLGWFAPQAAAQISRREKGSYYIGSADKVPTINGRLTNQPTKLLPGDIIEVAGIQFEFSYRA
jgi:predicted component of type VI protein secretion system